MSQHLFQRTPWLNGADTQAKREEIRAYFHTTLDRYESLFETLRTNEAYYEKPISLRHPLIFYYGHTATFFINKLILTGGMTDRINPALESICAVGVDEMSWDDLDDTNYDWPTVEAVRNYRGTMRSLVDKLIRELPLTLPISWQSPWWAILMGVEHERIHLETSSVLIRQHVLDHVQSHPDWEPCRESGEAPQNRLIDISAGTIRIGKDFTDPAKMLTAIQTRLNSGGLLIIASPYTWSTEYTEKKRWIGGFKKDGDNYTTLDGLKELLGRHFKLIQGPQAMPFVIRETKRKFQHTLSEVTIWERRP